MYKNERNYEIDVIETTVRQVWSDIKSKSTSSESTKRIQNSENNNCERHEVNDQFGSFQLQYCNHRQPTKRIIAQVFGVYLNEVLHMLPSTDATAQQIRYKRRKASEHPPEPSNIGFFIPLSHPQLRCNTEAAFFFTTLKTET